MLIKEPTNIFDIIYGNDESRLIIEDLVTGVEPLPSAGKCAILLYGVYGTGKTTLAKLLPEAIELGKSEQELAMPFEFIACQQGHNGPQVMSFIDKVLSRVSLNASGLHYFVLDEVDNLTKLAQQSLKSALNTTRAIFVLTTNHVSTLDKGLLDRCVLVEMNAARADQLRPLALQMAAARNVVLNDEQLMPVIAAAHGSFRKLAHNVDRLARRTATANQAAIA